MMLPICSARRGAWGYRVACCLSISALWLSGCAQSPSKSMARMWDKMPSVRWSPKEGHADDDTPETSVAAKSRVKSSKTSEEAGEARVTDKSVAGKKHSKSSDPFASIAKSSNATLRDPFLEDELANQPAAKKSATAKPRQDLEAITVSRREQLKTELADDSQRAAEPELQSAEQARLRLRVESTMERARSHLENGELVAAQRAAELAQRLTESGGLEFAPDEERPIELLTDIIARREAQAEKAALANSEDSEAAEESADADTNAKENTAQRKQIDPAFAVSADEEFDPYARRAAAVQEAEGDDQVFITSMVVLEKPSFEDEANSVDPISYAREAVKDRRDLMMPFARKSASSADVMDEIPEPPADEEEVATAESELPIPSAEEFKGDAAPLPPIAVGEGPKLEKPALDDLPADLEQVADGAEEIKPAGALPRWLPLSLLSLLTAGLCVWLWRHRTMLNS